MVLDRLTESGIRLISRLLIERDGALKTIMRPMLFAVIWEGTVIHRRLMIGALGSDGGT